MTGVASLRQRLLLMILLPLIVISLIAGYWRFSAARGTAEELFDRTLLASTLAIARDVAISGGDALSPATRDLMRDTSGGEIFYHVNGPDGVFITGYATPPPPPPGMARAEGAPLFFNAAYRGESVRVARLREQLTIDGISGFATVTVWQNQTAREGFARQLGLRAALLMGSLILTVGLVVWFGVNRGLRPLTDLQEAISRRSSDDLGQIRRPVPREAQGLVDTLNTLFGQLERAMDSKDAFISDAAHQLRNPIAGVLSMAEAVRQAPTPEAAQERSDELLSAARHVSRLATQLLSFDRAKGTDLSGSAQLLDLGELIAAVVARNEARATATGITLRFTAPEGPVELTGDATLLAEAVENLIDNALAHAGPGNHRIDVDLLREAESAVIRVRDYGRGLDPEDSDVAFERFGQITPSGGSGLGLAIVREIAARHGGQAQIQAVTQGALIQISLPIR